jgi:hypothetical protein
VRPGGATRGKWRIPDVKVESGLFSYLKLRKWQPSPTSIKDRFGWALLQQALSCVLAHTWFMGSHKLSSFDGRWVGWHPTVVDGWHWDSVQATHGLPIEVLVLTSWLTCVVLLGWYLARLYYIDSNLRNTHGYGWDLFTVFKHRSAISSCSYEIYGYV